MIITKAMFANIPGVDKQIVSPSGAITLYKASDDIFVCNGQKFTDEGLRCKFAIFGRKAEFADDIKYINELLNKG